MNSEEVKACLEGLSNLSDADDKLKVLIEILESQLRGMKIITDILESQHKMIAELKAQIPQIYASEGNGLKPVERLEMNCQTESYTWFRATTREGRNIDTLPLKGEL